jgi:hypothetical protein
MQSFAPGHHSSPLRCYSLHRTHSSKPRSWRVFCVDVVLGSASHQSTGAPFRGTLKSRSLVFGARGKLPGHHIATLRPLWAMVSPSAGRLDASRGPSDRAAPARPPACRMGLRSAPGRPAAPLCPTRKAREEFTAMVEFDAIGAPADPDRAAGAGELCWISSPELC